jgi:hypothetical protein
MTTTQRIKDALIAYLEENKPDESIAVVDARQRDAIELPTLAVDIVGATAHSTTLSSVTQAEAQITLRHHAGDEPDADIPAWIDSLESIFFDKSRMISICGDPSQLIFYDWNYNGSTQDFDDAILEVAFTASILFARQ